MKFSEVFRGTRAERRIVFSFYGHETPILLRPLSALEESDAAAYAVKTATGKGTTAAAGDSVYDAAYAAQTLSLACLDADSPTAARTPFFDGGPDQVLRELDADTIGALFADHQIWQERCSPALRVQTAGDLFALAKKVAEDDDPLVFARMSQRTQWSLLRFSAALLVHSQVLKSSSSSPLSESGTTSAAAATESA